MNAEKVIKYSIKFIKLLNSYIYDLGTGFNTVKRQVYRGLRAEVLKDVKEGDVFRFTIIQALINKYIKIDLYF